MTSRLVASCCFVCLLVPVASFSQPKNTKNRSDLSSATITVRELRIPEKARTAFNKGVQRLAAKDFAGSIGDFQKAIVAYSEFYEAYYKIGIANLGLQLNDAAETAFRKSIELSDAKYAPSLFGLGLTLANEKQFGDAEPYVRAGLQLEPTSAPGHFALAWVFYTEQRVVEAEKSAREALRYNPNLAMAHLLLAQIHQRQHNSAAMVEELDAFLRIEPDGARSRALRTKRDEAEQSLNRETEAKPDETPISAVDR